MKSPRYLVAVLLAAVLALTLPGVASAARPYRDSVSGFEVYATLTRGTFTGQASGDLPGAWGITVDHPELNPGAPVTGGSFYLATAMDGRPTLIAGEVGGGEVLGQHVDGCADQVYDVYVTLVRVAGNGKGWYDGTLTHHRTSVFGRCILYSATVTGSLELRL
jgi:hypothetical protein